MTSPRSAGAIVLIVVGALPLIAQQTGNQPADPLIRVTVNLVQVDAVVTDSKGRHVRDLKPEDFRILEDGKPQKITHFSYVEGNAIQSAPKSVNPAPKRGSEAHVEENLAPVKELPPDQVRRTMVLIADDLGLSADDIVAVRKVMKNFVDRNMQIGDLVSIMTTSGGMGAMEQLTNDKRQLYVAIDRIHWSPSRTRLTWYEPVHTIDVASKFENDSNRRVDAIRRPSLATGTLSAVAFAIQGLREMPGRKAIAFFSDGFNQEVSGIVELANRALVTIYTLDPRGLASFFLSSVDWCKPPNCDIRAEEKMREATYRASQTSLDQMARGTGGIFFHDNNALDNGLTTALDDMGSYYVIGYEPRREDFDRVRGNLQYHKIDVKVLGSGLQVRSRNGFVGVPDPPPVTETARSPNDELRIALFSPFHANRVPVHLSAFYSASSDKDPKTGRRHTLVRATLAIDAHALRFKDTPEGKKELDLDVVAAAFGANNEIVTTSSKTFSAAMTNDEMNQIVASGLVYGIEFSVPKPGPYQVRVALRDEDSGQTGSASTFIEVPDFNRAAIAMSSLLLHDSDLKRNEGLIREGVLGAGSPVTRVFTPGASIQYDCAVFGAVIDRQTAKPKVDIELRLFHGSEQIFSGQPTPIPIPNGNSTMAFRATGEIKVSSSLAPGDYSLEMIVYDRLARRKYQHAEQWVDFTLVK